MRKWAGTSAKSVLLAAGFVALGSGVAFADSDVATSGNGSLLGGNQAVVNADVPVNVTGNAIGAVAGVAGASSTDSDAKVVGHHNEVHTSGNGSVLGGNQLVVDGDVPVNVAGNAIGAVGGVAGAAATDADAIVRHHQSAPVEYQSGRPTTDMVAEVVENAQILPDTSGVDVGLLRQSAPVREHQSAPAHGHRSIATSGNGSLLGGNQGVIDLDVPVNVAGNAIGAVGGVAGASSTDSDAVVKGEHTDIATSGNGSVLGGNQLVVDGDVPVNLTGNAVGAVLGTAGASSTDSDSKVVHQSAQTEAQSSALDSVPLVDRLPEVPVSEMVPVDYGLSETAHRSVDAHAPERLNELPAPAELPDLDPVGDLLGAVGVGL